MGTEGGSSEDNAVVATGESTPSLDNATNKHVLASLTNIDRAMGQMAGPLAKIFGQSRPKDKRKTADKPSDSGVSDSEPDPKTRRSTSQGALGVRETSLSDNSTSLHADEDLNDD